MLIKHLKIGPHKSFQWFIKGTHLQCTSSNAHKERSPVKHEQFMKTNEVNLQIEKLQVVKLQDHAPFMKLCEPIANNLLSFCILSYTQTHTSHVASVCILTTVLGV